MAVKDADERYAEVAHLRAQLQRLAAELGVDLQ
jgi:hypothetical protein